VCFTGAIIETASEASKAAEPKLVTVAYQHRSAPLKDEQVESATNICESFLELLK